MYTPKRHNPIIYPFIIIFFFDFVNRYRGNSY